MADHSKIEWTEASWPVVTGCEHISRGCDNCYAAKLTSGRLRHRPEYTGLAVNGKFTGEVRMLPERLGWPLSWRKPRRIFVCSMSDLFHDEVSDGFIARVFAVMALTRRHTFQVLTKRHGRMRSLLSRPSFYGDVVEHVTDLVGSEPWQRWQLDLGGQRLAGDSGMGAGWTATRTHDGTTWSPPWPLPNVWGGVSVEDQKQAGIRIPVLLDTPLAVRWISAEPLLGPVDLHNCAGVDALEPDWAGGPTGGTGAPHPLLDWVVVGGESGRDARPMSLNWTQQLVDQCQGAGTPVFVKQLGSLWGRHHHEIAQFPAGLRVREYPKQVADA